MEPQLRKRVAREAHVRIALVIAKENVVARLLRLDQVVFEQQCLALGARDGRLHTRDLREHHGDSRFVRALLKIARNPFFEVARLADVERLAGRIEHPVDTRTMRQGAKKLRHVERGRRRRLGRTRSRHFRQT